MDSVFKSMVGFFFLALITVTSVCVISASIDNSNARSYHTAILNELEESNYSETVINILGDTALSQGYDLEMVFHREDGTIKAVSFTKDKDGNVQKTPVNDISDVAFAEVNLGFEFTFRLMGAAVPHVIKGVAR